MVLSPGGGRAGASCPGRQEGEPSRPVWQCVLGGLRTPEATAEPQFSVVDPVLGRPVHEALAGRWPSRCELPRTAGGGAEPAGLPVRAGRPADSGGHGGATLVRSRSGAGEACSWCSRRDGCRAGASCPGRQEGEPSLPVCQCVLGGLRTSEATAEPRLSVVDPALGGLFIVLSPGGGRAGASCPGRQEGEPSLPVCQCVLGGLRTPRPRRSHACP